MMDVDVEQAQAPAGTRNSPWPMGRPRPPPANPMGPGCDKMDILFVIDDSGSMEEEHERRQLPRSLRYRRLDECGRKPHRLPHWVTTTGKDIKSFSTSPIPRWRRACLQDINEMGDICEMRQEWADSSLDRT